MYFCKRAGEIKTAALSLVGRLFHYTSNNFGQTQSQLRQESGKGGWHCKSATGNQSMPALNFEIK